MYEMKEIGTLPSDWLKYYLTQTGKIWGVRTEDLLSGDAQQRRELIGNSFDTYEEAALAKIKLEASHRLAPYAKKHLQIIDGSPAIVTKFHLTTEEYNLLKGDIVILANS